MRTLQHFPFALRSRRPTILRHCRLAGLRVRRVARRSNQQLILFGGWTWVAALSLIGFETFDILFLSFALAPEFIPLVIILLAIIWFLRERLRAVWSQIHLHVLTLWRRSRKQ